MTNIVINQNGVVTGDKGKIIAYSGDKYSQPVHIIYPQFAGCRYFVEYIYGNTTLRNPIDSNGNVSFKIENEGYMKCQFIAEDIAAGNSVFRSNLWYFVIHRGLKPEPEHYPCCHHGFTPRHIPQYSYGNPPHPAQPFDSYKAYFELETQIRNEEEIRFQEMQTLYNKIAVLEEALNININETPMTVDANNLTVAGTYSADENSTNFPIDNQAYKCIVSDYNNGAAIMQNAYEIDSDNVWYRTAVKQDSEFVFSDWTPLITRVDEI